MSKIVLDMHNINNYNQKIGKMVFSHKKAF